MRRWWSHKLQKWQGQMDRAKFYNKAEWQLRAYRNHGFGGNPDALKQMVNEEYERREW